MVHASDAHYRPSLHLRYGLQLRGCSFGHFFETAGHVDQHSQDTTRTYKSSYSFVEPFFAAAPIQIIVMYMCNGVKCLVIARITKIREYMSHKKRTSYISIDLDVGIGFRPSRVCLQKIHFVYVLYYISVRCCITG